ncbi:transcription initiation factor TFIID subunit 3 [Labeo rohita]|uniref:Transcription initiation factor TFIID subunit 3 n=1 Tax=Labeo rohita TaxID=84645 RepID=A0A498LDU3_LABRO|nr:transcription initiation factor TFIID subunit 3 [Labeo rohita]
MSPPLNTPTGRFFLFIYLFFLPTCTQDALRYEEEEEPVPADMGTSAEAMQVSLGEEEEGEEEENDENWLSRHGGQSPRPEGLLPAAKRPRLSTKPGVSPEWSYEPREPLSSLNSQHMPHSPSPPLSPELPRPPLAPPTPGHKPKLPSPSPARQKSKSPKRGGGSAPTGVLGRPLMLTPPKTNQKAGKRSPGRPKSPRSPRPSPAHLGAAGRGWPGPLGDDNSRDGQFRAHDTGDEDIENSIAAVIARACADGDGASDPFAYDSDSDSEGPNPPKPAPKHTLSHIKPPQVLTGKHPLPPVPPNLNPPNRWTMDDSIDEVIRKANQAPKPIQAPSLSPPEPTYLSSPPDSPPTPLPPLKPPQERKDPATATLLKKKLKKDIKAKLKKKDKERLKEKGKEKGKNKEKNKEKKREKERGQADILPAVPPSPVIPRLTLRVGAGQDKIVISKVVPDSEPTPPPPRTPVARPSPAARMRSPPAPPPPAPAPVAPPPRPPPVLPPPPPVAPIQPPPSQAKARGCSVVTETVSAYVIRDEWGNQIWICPGCNKPDDGSPMIGCDECDDWYHWPCVGLVAAPPEDQSWFCVKCAGKKKDKKTKKRKRKAH